MAVTVYELVQAAVAGKTIGSYRWIEYRHHYQASGAVLDHVTIL